MAQVGTLDWSKLDRSSIFNMVMLCQPLIIGKTLLINDLHRMLTRHIKQHLPLKLKKQLSADTAFGEVWVGGAYYSDLDRELQNAIVLVLQYNPFEEYITLTKLKFKRIAISIADTILHEIIHMRQYRARQFRVLPDYPSTAQNHKQRASQRYLGCTDEIDAYSFNIACELNAKFKSNSTDIVTYLNKPQNIKRVRSTSWTRYLLAFDNNHNHRIIKRVKKRVIHYLPHAILGKPYKNSDWLRQ